MKIKQNTTKFMGNNEGILRKEFVALIIYIKNQKDLINNLVIYLQDLENQKTNSIQKEHMRRSAKSGQKLMKQKEF